MANGFSFTTAWHYTELANLKSGLNYLVATYKNTTGSSKKINSVTMDLGYGYGQITNPYPGSAYVNGKESFRAYVEISGKTSDIKTISNRCNVSTQLGSHQGYDQSACKSYTFTFTNGPIVSNGSTVNILVKCPNGYSSSAVFVRHLWNLSTFQEAPTLYITGSVGSPANKPNINISSNKSISTIDEDVTITADKNTQTGTATSTTIIVNGKSSNMGGGNGPHTLTYKPKDKGVGDGTQYTVSASRTTSGAGTTNANSLSLKTYRTPKITSLSLNATTFSGAQATNLDGTRNYINKTKGIMSFSVNTRKWNSEEDPFTTSVGFTGHEYTSTDISEPSNTSDSNQMYSKTHQLTAASLWFAFNKDSLSVPSITTTVSAIRRNISSGVEAEVTSSNITMQFQPKYTVSNLAYKTSTGSGISAGSTIYTSDIPSINVSWSYQDRIDGGVVDGYYVRIYSDSSYSNLMKEYKVATTSLNSSISINTKSALKRGTMNYIKITAYYRKPNGSGDLEGPALTNTFVLPLGRLQTPVIDYPKAGTWHNSQFRICFTLPSDDDDDVISTSSYSYKAVELEINGVSYTFSSYPSIFSTTSLSEYRKAIVINPSLISGFPITNAYKIRIRVQKNYFTQPWSNWSSLITLNNTAINNLTITSGTLIRATQYNTLQGYSTRLYSVYPFSNRPSLDVSKKAGDIISKDNFLGIYNTILGIQSLVNNYATFASNRTNVKFNQSIIAFNSPNQPTQEYIMAEKDTRNNTSGLKGRNYFNILIDCMNQLK